MIFAANGELDKTTCQLLGKLAIEHPDSNSNDPGTALGKVLRKSPKTKNLKCLKWPLNKNKFYDPTGPIKIPIILDEIDCTTSVNILQKIFIPYLIDKYRNKSFPKDAACIVGHHQTGSYQVDVNDKCTTCGVPGIICRMDGAVEVRHKLRNLISHMRDGDYKKFIEKTLILPDLQHCKTVDDVYKEIENIMKNIMNFLTSQVYLTKGQEITPDEAGVCNKLILRVINSDDDFLRYFTMEIKSTWNSRETGRGGVVLINSLSFYDISNLGNQ